MSDFDLGEVVRLMRDPDLTGQVIALVTAMHANDTGHPTIAERIAVVPLAFELTETPERAAAGFLQLAALLVATLGADEDTTVDSVLQRWALL